MGMIGTVGLAVDRWTPYVETLRFAGIDLTGATFHGQVRRTPDAAGDPLIDLATVATPGVEGFRLKSVDTSGSVPISTVEIRIDQATVTALPAAPSTGDDVRLAWDMHITPADGVKQKRLAGPFVVRAGVTR